MHSPTRTRHKRNPDTPCGVRGLLVFDEPIRESGGQPGCVGGWFVGARGIPPPKENPPISGLRSAGNRRARSQGSDLRHVGCGADQTGLNIISRPE